MKLGKVTVVKVKTLEELVYEPLIGLILKHYMTTHELGTLAKGATVKVKTPEGKTFIIVPKFKPMT